MFGTNIGLGITERFTKTTAKIYGMLSLGYSILNQIYDFGIYDMKIADIPNTPAKKEDVIPLGIQIIYQNKRGHPEIKVYTNSWIHISGAKQFTFKIEKMPPQPNTEQLELKLMLYAFRGNLLIPHLTKEIKFKDGETVSISLQSFLDYYLRFDFSNPEDYYVVTDKEELLLSTLYKVKEWNVR